MGKDNIWENIRSKCKMVDGKLTYDGSLDLSSRRFKKIKMDGIDVLGSFRVAESGLKSIEGSPRYVGGVFSMYNNKITSLKGGPEIVVDEYTVALNSLKSLEGSPKKVHSFYCYDNPLKSLKDGPEIVETHYSAFNTGIRDLNGIASSIGGNLFVTMCPNLITLEGLNDLGGLIHLDSSQVDRLKNDPYYIQYCLMGKIKILLQK